MKKRSILLLIAVLSVIAVLFVGSIGLRLEPPAAEYATSGGGGGQMVDCSSSSFGYYNSANPCLTGLTPGTTITCDSPAYNGMTHNECLILNGCPSDLPTGLSCANSGTATVEVEGDVAVVGPSPPTVYSIAFVVQPLPGNWTCPPPWYAGGEASVACGTTGSYVESMVGQQIMTEVILQNAQPGTYKVEIRQDLISWPDVTLKTFSLTLNAAGASSSGGSTSTSTLEVGPWSPDAGTCGGSGCFWPLDVGATREFYVKVWWDGHLIYDPTGTVAVYGIGPIPIWATLGRPEVQALCSDGGSVNGFGWC